MLESTCYAVHGVYLRTIAHQRTTRIIIALRRYKNEHDTWPESLEKIKSLASEEIFVDPITGDSFVYKPTEENFTLYSKGKNKIDEKGKSSGDADDLLIWPSRKSINKQKKDSNDKYQ